MAGLNLSVAGISVLLIAALVLSLIAAAAPELLSFDAMIALSIVLGIAIGLFSITKSESVKFLIAYLVLIASAGFLALLPTIGEFLQAFFGQFFVILGIAGFLIAIRIVIKTLIK